MNTTELIAHWTMQGAGHDINGRFRKTDDIRAILGDQRDAPPAAVPTTLRVRGSDEDDWTPLGAG